MVFGRDPLENHDGTEERTLTISDCTCILVPGSYDKVSTDPDCPLHGYCPPEEDE